MFLVNRTLPPEFGLPGFGGSEHYFRTQASLRKEETAILLVPTSSWARKVEREVVAALQPKAVGRLHVYTFSEFASTLLQHSHPKVKLISDAESGVFLEQVIWDLHDEARLHYFERPAAAVMEEKRGKYLPVTRGTFELILNTIRQLKRNGIYPEPLRKDIIEATRKNGETTETRRARDIQAIYAQYEELIANDFTDTYGQFQLLNGDFAFATPDLDNTNSSSIETVFRSVFRDAKYLLVEGFDVIDRPALDLLTAISRVPELAVAVHLSIEEKNEALFGTVSSLKTDLELAGFSREEEAVTARQFLTEKLIAASTRENEPLDLFSNTVATGGELPDIGLSREEFCRSLARNLFADAESVAQTRLQADRHVVTIAADNQEAEIESVARAIKLLVRENPQLEGDLSRIGVALTNDLAYSDLCREVFRRFGIEVNILDRHKLDSAAIFQSILSLLEIARSGLRRREIIRAFSSPYFVLEHNNEIIDSTNLLAVMAEYHLTGDDDAWLRMIDSALGDVEQRLEEAERDEEEYEIRDQQLAKQRLLKARRDVEAITIILAPFRSQIRPAEFKQRFGALLSNLQFGRRLLSESSLTLAAGTLELDARAYRSLIKLIEDLDVTFGLLNIQDEELDLGFYLERIRVASFWTRYNPMRSEGAVQVASLEQMMGQEFDHLFIVGLSDGVFPTAYEPQVFLMRGHQKGELRQLQEERALFYRVATSFRSKLYLTWPKRSTSGKEQNESPFVTALRDIASLGEIDPKQLGQNILSERDFYRSLGMALQRSTDSATASKGIIEEYSGAVTKGGFEPVGKNALTTIGESLVASAARSTPADTSYRGMIATERLDDRESSYLESFRSRVWSISQLEQYASCGFSFFSKYILTLSTVQEPEEGRDALAQGNLLHDILRDFFTDRRQREQLPIQDLGEEDYAQVLADARAVAEHHIAESVREHPFWRIDTEWLLGTGKRKGILERVLDKERELYLYSPRPRFFEVSFGSKTGTKNSSDPELGRAEPIEFDGLRFRGKIDRIDIADGHFTIVDYKSGSGVKKLKELERGTSLQLPLYLKVAEDLLQHHFGSSLKGVAGLYSLLKGKESKRELGVALKQFAGQAFEKYRANTHGLIETEEEMREIIDRSVLFSKQYVEGVLSGEFPLVAKDLEPTTCQYCDYRLACRVREAKDLDLLSEPKQLSVQ